MINSRPSRPESALDDSFERYLQDKGKGRGGDGGNYRRNAARELRRFAEWAAGDRGESLELAGCVASVVPAIATAAFPLVLQVALEAVVKSAFRTG